MIRSSRRAADVEDLKAMTHGKGSLVRNVLMLTLPMGLILFLGTYWLVRSYVVALVVAGLVALGSIWSNVRFFRTVGQRGTPSAAQSAVEILEVEAARVLDIEHLGSHGPAYCFFAGDGTALLLVGQWLIGIPRFPSLSFQLHRWADDGKPIRIEATGRTVEPEQSTVALQGHYSNGDIEVFRAQPHTLQQDLENAFGKGAS